nr:hypothetical protein [Pseudomonadota bacterium]
MQQKSARPQFFKKTRFQPSIGAIPLVAPTPSTPITVLGQSQLQIQRNFEEVDLEMHQPIVVRDRRRCVGLKKVSKGVYGVAFVIIDSNMDAFIGEELYEYITAKKLESLVPLGIGFAGNVVPNIPWLIAIMNIVEKENKHKHHHHDGEHHDHDHDHDENSWGHLLQDLALIFLPTCAVSFAAGWDTVNRLSFSVVGVAPPLALLITMAAIAGMILGAGDFIIHRHYFHAAGSNPWKAFKTTYGENLLFRQDWGFWSPLWKALMFWIKTANILAHLPSGYFSAAILLEVTGLEKLLPLWLNICIPLLPAISMTIFEAITETSRVDRLWGT